ITPSMGLGSKTPKLASLVLSNSFSSMSLESMEMALVFRLRCSRREKTLRLVVDVDEEDEEVVEGEREGVVVEGKEKGER
ncbi:MAG: hypothetical protein L6R38_009074, partial [Xanthoria sp. 2 TBL-2021]